MNMRPLPTAAELSDALDTQGYATIPAALDPDTCAALIALHDADQALFRKQVVMEQHGYGRGAYKYFARPLPPIIQQLRELLYPPLAQIANGWATRLSGYRTWPETHAALVDECAATGQLRPTPLLLKYGVGDYNRLHQDVYGDLVFPLQAIIQLNLPARDFTGGELVLVEGRARMQSRPIIVPFAQGDIAIVPVRERPIQSARGWARAAMRHGVGTVLSGQRHTLGLIFHDAK